MSLINRMLSDLEERRGGNLRNVDQAIDGLRATPSPAVRRKKRIAPATLATGLLIAGLGALCAYLFFSRPPASAVAVTPPPTAVPVPVIAPALPAQPSPAAPGAPAPQAVVITDTPAPATVPQTPAARAAEPAPPAPQASAETAATPPAPAAETAAVWPEPEPAPPPAPEHHARQRMLSKANTDAQSEPLVEAPARASTRPERLRSEGSFHIAEATPPSTAEQAIALLQQGDNAGAEAMLHDGLASAPGDSAMARVLGHILLARNEAGAAVQVLQPAAPAIATDPEYNALLAAAEQRSGAHAQAIRRYRALLEQSPGNGAWLVGLGISLQATGEARAAADAFLQALADPALPTPLHDFAMQQSTQLRQP
jgi:Flp pilus assembly protein TadD